MLRWKESGVVEDSDDEALLERSISPSPPGSRETAPSDYDGRDADERPGDSRRSSLELDRPADLRLHDANAISGLHHLSSDSELSDVPEDFQDDFASPPQDLPSVQVLIELSRPAANAHAVAGGAIYPPAAAVQHSGEQTDGLALTQLLSEPPRRTLRKRNDIQLHPYLLEQQQYLKACLARGVKPVRVRVDDARAAPFQESEETQVQHQTASQSTQSSEGDFRLESSASESQDRTRRPVSSSSQPDEAPLTYADDELPEVGDLLRATANHRVELGSKRRKIVYSRRRVDEVHQPGAAPHVATWSRTQDDSSPHQLDNQGRIEFRRPPSLPPPPMLTATTPQQPQSLISPDESDSDPVLPNRSTGRRRNRRPASGPLSSSAGSDDSDASGASEILRAQRRIRGVLPASWLRLDLQAQTKRLQPSASPPRDRAGVPHDQSRGVAQRVIRPKSSRPTHHEMPSISVGSGSESDEGSPRPLWRSSPPRRAMTPERHLQHQRSSVFLDDVEEDNTVDAMLPAQPRGPRRANTGKPRERKRQSTLTDMVTNAKLPHEPRTTIQNLLHSKVRLPARRRRIGQASTRFKPPRLSIIDADESDDDAAKKPQFLRLARRAARQQDDLGRASPRSKLIQLQSLDDTEEAHAVLRRWARGSIQPRAIPRQRQMASSTRQPLAPMSRNTQRSFQSSSAMDKMDTDAAAVKTVTPRIRPQTLSAAKDLRQSRLNQSTFLSLPPATAPAARDQHVASTRAKPVIERRVLAKRVGIRNAQLEALAPPSGIPEEHFTLTRFLQQSQAQRPRQSTAVRPNSIAAHARGCSEEAAPHGVETGTVQQPKHAPAPRSQPVARRPRKRPGRHIDVQARELEQLFQPVFPASLRQEASEEDGELGAQATGLVGLPPVGTSFTVNFDAARPPAGTDFPRDTFVGSGELEACLRFSQRDLNAPTTACTIPMPDGERVWSAWSEQVASDVQTAFRQICLSAEGLQAHDVREDDIAAVALLRCIVTYVATTVYFTDPLDCASLVRCFSEQSRALHTYLPKDSVGVGTSHSSSLHTLLLALECMTLQLAKAIQFEDAESSERLLQRSAQSIFALWTDRAARRRQSFTRMSTSSDPDDHHIAPVNESLVAAHHLLKEYTHPTVGLWSVAHDAWLPGLEHTVDVRALESVWNGMFSLLALVQYNSFGRIDGKATVSAAWSIPKVLILRVLSLYESTTGKTASLNAYVRTLLVRCYHLLVYWEWDSPETVLYVWFDFFAARKLGGLRLEDVQGSLRCLEDLYSSPDLNPASDDSTFQMLLKFLAKGLLSLRSVHSDRKIQGIVWRFVPAHGRTYPKENSLAQEDLHALRNHHDLLSILYWASPATCRPRLDLLQRLVDHSVSHREACRLNVRAWSNLTRYQASTDEPLETLQPLIAWCRDILAKTIVQYRVAKTEAEAQQATWKAQGDKHFTFEYVSRIVDRNQRQVLATLAEAVNGLRSAVSDARSVHVATALIRDSRVSSVLSLCSERSDSVGSVTMEVFALYRAYVNAWSDSAEMDRTSQVGDDSQDYGEWPDWEGEVEDAEENTASSSTKHQSPAVETLDLIEKPVQQYLSDIFGSEGTADAKAVESALETLVRIAKIKVGARQSDWAAYLDPHGAQSWDNYGDSDKARRFAPLFYALAVECDPFHTVGNLYPFAAQGPQEEALYNVWLSSLVGLDSQLAYQDRLTQALLNCGVKHELPLLHNAPFWTRTLATMTEDRNAHERRYVVTLHEVRDRRLSLLGTVFTNMRRALCDPLRDTNTRSLYRRLLRRVMTAMKRNYLDVKQQSSLAERYVDFVHSVLGLLTQHTAEICPVDSFFTDGQAFPIFEKDPSYIVAKLKSYAPRLDAPKSQKEFATFLHNLLQQAVANGGQAAATFADRLHTVVSDVATPVESRHLALLDLVAGGIFPVYLEHCFQNGKGHDLVQVFLSVITRAFRDMQTRLSTCRPHRVQAASELILGYLDSATLSLLPLLAETSRTVSAEGLRTLAQLVQTVEILSPTIDYLIRLRLLPPTAWAASGLVADSCDRLILRASGVLSDDAALVERIRGRTPLGVDRFRELRQFMHRSVQESLPGARSDLHASPSFAEQRALSQGALDRLRATLGRMTSNGGKRQKQRAAGFGRELMAV